MIEEKNKKTKDDQNSSAKVEVKEIKAETKVPEKGQKSVYAKKSFQKKGKKFKKERPKEEFEQRIVDLARVTRVMAGGKRMRFRACIIIGDRKGKVGVGVDKGADVPQAVNKAVQKAKKNLIDVPQVNDTIPHEIYYKKGAAKLLIKPARKGKGVIAGGAARVVFDLSGIKNITCKIMGTNNNVNIAKCTIEALDNIKKVDKPKKDTVKKTEKKKDQKPVEKKIQKSKKVESKK